MAARPRRSPIDLLDRFRHTGLPRAELLTKHSGELPAAVDGLTPAGRVPSDDELARRVTPPH